MKSRPVIVIALGLALVVSAAAEAQNNRPYVPGFGRPGAGVGMSAAAREAVLNEELFGRTPGELVRGPNGLLLDVRERDNNAYLQVPGGGNILPGARPGRGWPTGMGTGLGWNNAGFSDNGASYGLISLGRSRSLNSWIAQLPAGVDGAGGGGGVMSGGTPIDTWISQLDRL